MNGCRSSSCQHLPVVVGKPTHTTLLYSDHGSIGASWLRSIHCARTELAISCTSCISYTSCKSSSSASARSPHADLDTVSRLLHLVSLDAVRLCRIIIHHSSFIIIRCLCHAYPQPHCPRIFSTCRAEPLGWTRGVAAPAPQAEPPFHGSQVSSSVHHHV
jgi:hypothetical protein